MATLPATRWLIPVRPEIVWLPFWLPAVRQDRTPVRSRRDRSSISPVAGRRRTLPGMAKCPETRDCLRAVDRNKSSRLDINSERCSFTCAPTATRTRDLLLRRQSLYPLSYRGPGVSLPAGEVGRSRAAAQGRGSGGGDGVRGPRSFGRKCFLRITVVRDGSVGCRRGRVGAEVLAKPELLRGQVLSKSLGMISIRVPCSTRPKSLPRPCRTWKGPR